LFIVSVVTWGLGGNVITGNAPIGPPHLNHGYIYYNGAPPLITLIDVGQVMFLFVVGVSAYIAFSSRLRKRGAAASWMYAGRRVGILMALSFLVEFGLRADWNFSKISWERIFYSEVIAHLAIGCLAAYLAIFFVRNPDRRAAVGFIIFIIHAFVFGAYLVDRYIWWDHVLELPKIPLGAINLAGIAIIGTAVGQWITRDPDDPAVGMRERIAPLGWCCMAGCFFLEWVQPSEHHDVTAPLALMGVGLSSLLLVTAYAMNKIGIRPPLLGPLGRNLLFVFIFTALAFELMMSFVPEQTLHEDPFLQMVLLGIVPLAAMIGITHLLERWNIAIRA
jgi:hypothetical protein